MTRPNWIFFAVLVLACCRTTFGSADTLLGNVHAGTYGETTFEEIQGIDVTARRVFSNHTYDIVIPDTARGDPVIYCQLYDTGGGVLGQIIENSATRETTVHFVLRQEASTARCFFAPSERLTRPSGPTPNSQP